MSDLLTTLHAFYLPGGMTFQDLIPYGIVVLLGWASEAVRYAAED
jgi:hypothetical protein